MITLVTLVLAFLGGFAADVAAFMESDLITAVRWPEFWDTLALNLFDNPELWGEYSFNIVLAVAFGILGAFSVIRGLAKASKQEKTVGQII